MWRITFGHEQMPALRSDRKSSGVSIPLLAAADSFAISFIRNKPFFTLWRQLYRHLSQIFRLLFKA